MDYNILIVEDEPKLREVMSDYFISRGDKPVCAENGMKALEAVEERQFDAVLLDIMMPELDGFSVCRALRKKNDVPIIFLTALSDEDDKLLGYELGADDYVTKPFSLSILYARTCALIKRDRGSVIEADKIKLGKLTINTVSHSVLSNGKAVQLTPKEYALLLCLAQNKGIVLSREQLLVKCWGYDYEGDARAVDTHIKRLRAKLGESAECIKTIVKAGYKLEV